MKSNFYRKNNFYRLIASTALVVVFIVGCSVISRAQSITCGLPGVSNNQSCFVTSTTPVALPNPIPSWGPNSTVSAGGNPYLMQTVGNLTGSGVSVTPTDFNRPMIRCTDVNFYGVGVWGLADNGQPNLFSGEDSGGNFFIAPKAFGGTFYPIYVESTGVCHAISGISFPNGVIFNHASVSGSYAGGTAVTLYSLEGTSSTQIWQNIITVTGCPSACALSSNSRTMLYDFSNANCILNAYNGNPTWTAGSGSVGIFTNTLDDTGFSVYYSDHNVAGQLGRWVTAWNTAWGPSSGCYIWDTQSQKYMSHTGTQGVVAITPASQAGDEFRIHEEFSALSDNYVIVSTGQQSSVISGTYYGGYYFAQIDSPNVMHAGYPSPAPIGGFSINGALTSGTFTCTPTCETVTQTTSGAHGIVVNQTSNGGTVGFTTGSHVLQLGAITGVLTDASDTWVGGTSGAVFTPIAVPVANPTFNYNLSGHAAELYNGMVAGKNGAYGLYASYPSSSTLPATTPNGAPCADLHMSVNHQNTNDEYPVLVHAQDFFAFANLLQLMSPGNVSGTVCPPPPFNSSWTTSPGIPSYYNENYFGNNVPGFPTSTGPVLRANHTFKSGWGPGFDSNDGGIAIQSSSGKWHMLTTDAYGQFGSTAGAPHCNVGGPDWPKSDTTDVVAGSGFGSFIMPQSNNNGNYVYQATSCTGGGCATGSKAPLQITTFALNSNPTGTAYVVNDVLTVTQSGGSSGTLKVTAVNGTGGITAATLLTGGQGYSTGTALPTTGGTGTGALVNITGASWPQCTLVSGCSTVTDNTITWTIATDSQTPTNSAVSNCRFDIILVSDFTLGAATNSSQVTKGNTKLTGSVVIK